LDKAAQTYRERIASYPREVGAYNNLGIIFALEGRFEEATQITRVGIRIAPNEYTLYENLTDFELALQHFDEARQIIRDIQPRKPDNYIFPAALYALAFLDDDAKLLADQQQWFVGKSEYETFGLALASDTEAFAGHLSKARNLTRQALDSAVRNDRKETGAIWQTIAAQREAAYGMPTQARQTATEALKMVPGSQGVEAEAGLAYALAGDISHAESLADDLAKRFPLDSQVQSLWLPAIRAQLALDRRNAEGALKLVESAAPPIEFGAIAYAVNTSCLYPTYVRGQAYLAAQQGREANAEFQKILDHGGIVWNCWTGALAHLGVARANSLQAKTSQGADADSARVRALAAYKEFLSLWRDADSDIPVLREARSEYAGLQ
jgi:tetratricopeptide (TPR) repeat protein